MTRYFIELAYNGTNYHGWQVQPNAISVQEVINDALGKILREKVNVIGCGRTDTGVHASYFVAHFDSKNEYIVEDGFCYKMNRILPKDIAVFSLEKVDGDTHSRFSATKRTYQYHIVTIKNPFLTEWAYNAFHPLDFESMNKACDILFDYEDFTSFSKLHTDVKTNNCKIHKAIWEYVNGQWIFEISADRFLRNMVRAIVGTLLDVGRGKMSIDEFRGIIEAKDRGVAGTSAPAHALFLVRVEYPNELFTAKHLRVLDR